MIDTHSHLQFKAFEGRVDEVIANAKNSGVEKIIIVGTNLETSQKAIALAQNYEGVFASVGIHPFHVFSYCHPALDAGSRSLAWIPAFAGMTPEVFGQLEQLVTDPNVVAIGETGMDRHIYKNTKYQNYQVTDEFIELQKLFFKKQIKLAIKHKKSLIIHNREAVPELLEILDANWDPFLEGRSVFHCCEPDQRLLDFALSHHIFIGVDGDVTYDSAKQDFVKKVPLELLVLETDSPYFIPEPLRRSPRESGDPIHNEPKNLNIIAEFIADLKKEPFENVRMLSSKNSRALFKI